MNRSFCFTLILIFFFQFSTAQTGKGFEHNYHFLQSGNLVADKDFYLLTVIAQTSPVSNLLSSDERLKSIWQEKMASLRKHVDDTCSHPESLLEDFRFPRKDSLSISSILSDVYDKHTSTFDDIINKHLRPSGYYQRFVDLSNKDLFIKAWAQYFTGINYIIDQFGLGKKMRYPKIDSASYDVNSLFYRTALKDMFGYLGEGVDSMKLFYQPSLSIAMQLMDLNDRDEPARFEPLASGENKKAVEKIKQTNWGKYKYSVILIPGNGPALFTTPISPINKMHCDIAAARFKQGLAPFIIVSGGYCYPFRGPYCEAVEMKKYLMGKFAISEASIIIEPFARHTTTNFRNANRLIIRYCIPSDKLCLFVTTKSQTDYVMSSGTFATAKSNFDDRNIKELGYLPYKNKHRISDHDIEFIPVKESLHMDPYDPLDP